MKAKIENGSDKNKNITEITLSNDLDIQSAEDIKPLFIEALKSGQSIKVILENVTSVDVTFIQLLSALKASASKLGKQLFIETSRSHLAKEIFMKSGYQDVITNQA